MQIVIFNLLMRLGRHEEKWVVAHLSFLSIYNCGVSKHADISTNFMKYRPSPTSTSTKQLYG